MSLARPFSYNAHTTAAAKAILGLGNSCYARLFARGTNAEFYVQPIVAVATATQTADQVAQAIAAAATTPVPANDTNAPGWAHIITGDTPYEIGRDGGLGYTDGNTGALFTHLIIWVVVGGVLEGITH